MTKREFIARALHEQDQIEEHGRIVTPWDALTPPFQDEKLRAADAAIAAGEAWDGGQFTGR